MLPKLAPKRTLGRVRRGLWRFLRAAPGKLLPRYKELLAANKRLRPDAEAALHPLVARTGRSASSPNKPERLALHCEPPVHPWENLGGPAIRKSKRTAETNKMSSQRPLSAAKTGRGG
jgi:hypothetical protein